LKEIWLATVVVLGIRTDEYVRTLRVSGGSVSCGLIWVDNLQTYFARNVVGILIMTKVLMVKIFEVVNKKLNMRKIYVCVVRFQKRLPSPSPLGNKNNSKNIGLAGGK
jgi:hypothetical protein